MHHLGNGLLKTKLNSQSVLNKPVTMTHIPNSDIDKRIACVHSSHLNCERPQTQNQCTFCLQPYCKEHQTFICTTCYSTIKPVVEETAF